MGLIAAHVARPEPVRKTGLVGMPHTVTTAEPIPDNASLVGGPGDPFYRHRIQYGDFYTQGKARVDPGVHRNYFTNIRGIQSIAQQFWGTMFTKLPYKKHPTIPRGVMRGIGDDVNVNVPPSVPHGDFATFDGYNRDRIRTLTRG